MDTQNFDTQRAEAFEGRMLDVINGGALALMTSIGHRSGLFDAMRGLAPSDSQTIAKEAGLQERYVREWLGAMVTGGIVDYEPDTASYHLPAEHAAVLTREARPNNMAVTAQWIPLLASVEDEVLQCFEQGGGVPYSSYDRFHAVMAEESDQTVVAMLIDQILPELPGVVSALERGIDVLDVGCGSGRALNRLARAFPNSRFTGFDVSPEGIESAQADARSGRLDNLTFAVHDVAVIPSEQSFDLITAFDAIHDQARPDAVLKGIAQALRPTGTFLMQDIAGTSCVHEDAGHPMAPFLYTVSCMHCMTVSLSSGGAGLGAMWGERTARAMLADAGFDSVEVKTLDHDPINYYYIARKNG